MERILKAALPVMYSPSDYDGHGVPDSVDNDSGTGWTNSDSDDGGVPDGVVFIPHLTLKPSLPNL